MEPGGNNGKLLLHSVGISGNRLCQISTQFKGVCQFRNSLLSDRGGHPKNITCKVQELNAGHKSVQIRIIRDVGNFLLAGKRIFPNGNAIDPDVTAVKFQNSGAGFQSRGFSGTVMSDKTVNFSRTNVQ